MAPTPPRVDCCVPVGRARLSDAEAEELERVFRAVADRHRLKLLSILAAAGDAVCVCALVPELGIAQPTVSYHLKQLAEAGLVEREKRGTYAYYRIAPGALERLGGLLAEPAPIGARSTRAGGSSTSSSRPSPGRAGPSASRG